MSDAFLDSDLTLDIRSALGQVDRLNEALSRATTGVRVTADVRAVTAAIDAAVEASDASVQIAAEARPVTGAIDAAVEEANTTVEVTGTAANVTGAIDAAVDNADTTVTVSGQVSPGLSSGVDDLTDSLDAASSAGLGLGTLLSGLSVAAAVAGLRELAEAASDLQESTSKASVVFADGFEDIDRFARDAASSTGLARQEALEATATFGNLFQALGTTREEATQLAPEVVQLAADLASFNNLGVDETLEKLRSGLVGEVEPLRSLGVSFLAADVAAKALELGLGNVNGELTEGEKVQARYALIQEQTSLAQGDFARTSDGLANQQRILQAELRNAAAAAGTALLPAFEALVSEARGAVPGLGQLAENVLPALADALANLAPLIGTSVDLLVALSPVISLVARVVATIPSPVIQAAGALLVLNRALAVTQTLAGARGLAALPGLLSRIALPAGTVSGAWGTGAANAGKLSTGLRGLTTGLSGATLAAGVGFTAFSMYQDVMASARAEGEEFGRSIRESVGDLGTKSMEELATLTATLDDEIVRMTGDIDDSFLGRNGVNRDYNASLNEGIDQMREFRAEVEAAQKALERAAAEAEFGPLIAQLTGTGDALGRLRDTAPAVASSIASLRVGTSGSRRDFFDLAVAIDGAALSEEQMADAAALLGIDVADLTAISKQAAEALTNFADTALGALPTVADAFEVGVGQGTILQVHEFVANLDASRESIVAFRDDLTVLAYAGFSDIAGVIAQQGPEVGGALAAELVAALEDGNVEVLETVRDATNGFNQEWLTTAQFFRDTIGPEFILQSTLLGTGITEAFGSELDFAERLRIAGAVARTGMSTEGQAIAAIAAVEGASAAREYGRALDIDQKVIDEAVKAGEAIRRNAPTGDARTAGEDVGRSFAYGVAGGLRFSQAYVDAEAARMVALAKSAADRAAQSSSPSRLFAELGNDIAEGLALGMEAEAARVAEASERLVQAAVFVPPQQASVVDSFLGEFPSGTAGAGSVLVRVEAGAIVVEAPEGMTRDEAVAVGEGIADGMTSRLAERDLAVLSRAT